MESRSDLTLRVVLRNGRTIIGLVEQRYSIKFYLSMGYTGCHDQGPG